MVATLRQLINEITNILPIARPPPIIEAIILINACQGDEYAMAKYTLGKTDSDLLTLSLAIEHLRTVEEEIKSKKDTANVAKGGKSGRFLLLISSSTVLRCSIARDSVKRSESVFPRVYFAIAYSSP